MKILHCISRLSGGGAERQLAYLAMQQAELGHSVSIAFREEGPDPPIFNHEMISLHRLVGRSNHSPFLAIQLANLMVRITPEVVNTWVLQMDVLAGLASSFLRIPWVLREPSSERAWPKTMKNRLRLMVAKRANAIISNSKGGDLYWSAHKPAHLRYVIPNALPLEQIRAVEGADLGRLGVPSGIPLVLYAGRLHDKEKNVVNTINAFVDVARSRSAILVICGDGPDRVSLNQHVQESGVSDRIFFLGHTQDVWSWMKAATVLVNISYMEGHPNTVLEAMACGCPLIVSDIPAHREFLDENAAIFVNPREQSQIRNALLRSLDDRANAIDHVQSAKHIVGQYSIERTAKEYLRVYEQIREPKANSLQARR